VAPASQQVLESWSSAFWFCTLVAILYPLYLIF
jgi:hypothetical protein